MRLVYTKYSSMPAGQQVMVGDRLKIGDGEWVEVSYFREPHKSSSEGKVSVRHQLDGWTSEYYVSVIGAEWIDREDRLFSVG